MKNLAEPAAAPFSHPLELIPYFRRFPCSRTRNLVYTFIWNCLFGGFFLLVNTMFNGSLPVPRAILLYFAIANFIGFAIHALYQGGQMSGLEAWVRRHGLVAKTIYYSTVPLIGVVAGMQCAEWIFHIGFGGWLASPGWIINVFAVTLIISMVLSTVFYLREREAASQVLLARERERNERVEREAVAANLRALQAQIEPHFLFNTLANVSSLIDRDAAEAKRMLERFIHFLRASLAATRTERTTLGAEGQLIAAYLEVLHVRMGPRLEYTVDVDPSLAAYPIAPMLLQPIVENAIRHGLEAKVDGGRVDFRVRRDADAVTIEVRDTGVGFAATTTGGVGLTNLRDRLRGLYGAAAQLSIEENHPSGTVVTLRLPP